MLSGALLRLPASVRLLSLEFDFSDAIAAVQRGERPATPQSKPTYYAVARSRFRVHTHVLQPWQFEFLKACGTRGLPLQGACDAGGADRRTRCGRCRGRSFALGAGCARGRHHDDRERRINGLPLTSVSS
jgi:hypothetical protein